jgi:signal transduction histidine kinase
VARESARPRRRTWFRTRIVATGMVLLVVGVLAGSAYLLNRRSLQRLELVDARLRETGQFTEVRARLQRYVVRAMPPALGAEDLFVTDLRIQIDQARSLGDRLPEETRASLDDYAQRLRFPIVPRSDLVSAAALIEELANAESQVHRAIFGDALADARAELATEFIGLGILGMLAILGLWAVPEAVMEPLRSRLRESTRTLLEQERALARSQQLALLGEAAATLAHEVRNPLAGTLMALQNLAREQPELSPRIAPLLGELERVNRTLRQYLGHVHAPPEPTETVDLGVVVDDLADLLRYQAPPSVRIKKYVEKPAQARAAPDSLRQVLLNLGLNAIEAMEPHGGSLTFAVQPNGKATILSVLDEGPGFPASVLNNQAEPFVSEKEGGAGIGLRVVRRLVTEMGGEVTFSNRPEGGARVDLALPLPEVAA